MTPARALHRDYREDIEGLAHRARIRLPEVILPDGTASPDQLAAVPAGVNVDKALLPYRELIGPLLTGPGIALVGTREPDLRLFLARGTAVLNDHRYHIFRAQSPNQILIWLYGMTGLRYAPAALWRVAGWEIGWVAYWLDRLRTGGAMGELIVAERQAAAATRAAWIDTHCADRADNSLVMVGAVLATRALVDMLAALDRVLEDAMRDASVRAAKKQIDAARAALLQRLRSCIRAIEDVGASRVLNHARRAKVGRALGNARLLVDSVGLFTAVGEPIGEGMKRISEVLPTKGRTPPPLTGTFAAELGELSARLERAIAGRLTPEMTSSWNHETVGDVSRLENADHQGRLDGLARVRTDLIYKLIVTRRLDRTFEALPWMAAPSGAFRLTYGGPLGAVASLFEVARYREIAVELTNRTLDPASGRLDTRQGKAIYSQTSAVHMALRGNTRAGFWLATSALSHHMVQALLAGRTFDPAHPLPSLCAGRLKWAFERSMHDAATITTVTDVELSKAIYGTKQYHSDLARYMGLTATDVLISGIADIFPSNGKDPGFNLFVRDVDERRKVHDKNENPYDQLGTAFRDLVRSILKSLDVPTDGNDSDWRTEEVGDPSSQTRELERFDERARHAGNRAKTGAKLKVRAAKNRENQGDPGKPLRTMIDRARSWIAGESDDRPLAAVLSGRHSLPGLTPVAQTGIAALWFYPQIDAPIHDWIAAGAPPLHSVAFRNMDHAGLITHRVQAVTKAMPPLFGLPIDPAVRRRIIVPLWTGLAGITEDHAHVG